MARVDGDTEIWMVKDGDTEVDDDMDGEREEIQDCNGDTYREIQFRI